MAKKKLKLVWQHLLRLAVCGLLAANAQANFDIAAELYQQKNYTAAFDAFMVLAEKGDPRAQTVVALMYKFGEGVEQDFSTAYFWYHKAAKLGYPPAQYHTGVMLADGLGTAADKEAAISYLNLATENGFERAIDKLAELNASANVLGKDSDELIAWSTDWDFKLPTEFVLDEPDYDVPAPTQVYLVQVGAMSTQAAANRLWEVLTSHHPNLFANFAPRITLAEIETRRVYRISTGPFPDFQSADEFCSRLMASTIQAGCLPVKPN